MIAWPSGVMDRLGSSSFILVVVLILVGRDEQEMPSSQASNAFLFYVLYPLCA